MTLDEALRRKDAALAKKNNARDEYERAIGEYLQASMDWYAIAIGGWNGDE